MLSIVVIVLVILLLVSVALIFFVIGCFFGLEKTVKDLKDKGWTVEPPEASAND